MLHAAKRYTKICKHQTEFSPWIDVWALFTRTLSFRQCSLSMGNFLHLSETLTLLAETFPSCCGHSSRPLNETLFGSTTKTAPTQTSSPKHQKLSMTDR